MRRLVTFFAVWATRVWRFGVRARTTRWGIKCSGGEELGRNDTSSLVWGSPVTPNMLVYALALVASSGIGYGPLTPELVIEHPYAAVAFTPANKLGDQTGWELRGSGDYPVAGPLLLGGEYTMTAADTWRRSAVHVRIGIGRPQWYLGVRREVWANPSGNGTWKVTSVLRVPIASHVLLSHRGELVSVLSFRSAVARAPTRPRRLHRFWSMEALIDNQVTALIYPVLLIDCRRLCGLCTPAERLSLTKLLPA